MYTAYTTFVLQKIQIRSWKMITDLWLRRRNKVKTKRSYTNNTFYIHMHTSIHNAYTMCAHVHTRAHTYRYNEKNNTNTLKTITRKANHAAWAESERSGRATRDVRFTWCRWIWWRHLDARELCSGVWGWWCMLCVWGRVLLLSYIYFSLTCFVFVLCNLSVKLLWLVVCSRCESTWDWLWLAFTRCDSLWLSVTLYDSL